MRYLLILPVALLAACSSTGAFVKPSAMTPAERCFQCSLPVSAS